MIKGRRRLVAAASLLFVGGWLVVLHSRSYTVQYIDTFPSLTDDYEKLIGDRIETFGAAAAVVSMFALLASVRFAHETKTPRWHPVLPAIALVSVVPLVLLEQIYPAIGMVIAMIAGVVAFAYPPGLGSRFSMAGAIGLGLVALVLIGVAEGYLAPKLWNFRPELQALEAFEVVGPFQVEYMPGKHTLENPAVTKLWVVEREFDEVREDLLQEINRWADPGTVEVVFVETSS